MAAQLDGEQALRQEAAAHPHPDSSGTHLVQIQPTARSGGARAGSRLASGDGKLFVPGCVEDVGYALDAWAGSAEQKHRPIPGKRRPGLVRRAVHVCPEVDRF